MKIKIASKVVCLIAMLCCGFGFLSSSTMAQNSEDEKKLIIVEETMNNSGNVTETAKELRDLYEVDEILSGTIANLYLSKHLPYLIDLAAYKESLPLVILFVENGAENVDESSSSLNPIITILSLFDDEEVKSIEDCLAIFQYLISTKKFGYISDDFNFNFGLFTAIDKNIPELIYLLVKRDGIELKKGISKKLTSPVKLAKQLNLMEMVDVLLYFGARPTEGMSYNKKAIAEKMEPMEKIWEKRVKNRDIYIQKEVEGVRQIMANLGLGQVRKTGNVSSPSVNVITPEVYDMKACVTASIYVEMLGTKLNNPSLWKEKVQGNISKFAKDRMKGKDKRKYTLTDLTEDFSKAIGEKVPETRNRHYIVCQKLKELQEKQNSQQIK
ncbi:MAG: hypothetical protein NTW04_05990 [Elusimicrobia bacterium]|nr:hypothetical protein [Elusimicrobiota bacterium]